MTPEATVSLLHLLDHWRLMLRSLSGEPAPPLPEVPGRIHALPQPTTPEQDALDLAGAAIWQQLADNEGADHD